MPRLNQRQRAEHTRTTLLSAARTLFAESGFAHVSLEQIVEAAEMTRGALYHYYRDKSDLFQAVFEQVESEIVAELIEVIGTVSEDLDADIERAITAYLDVCQRAEIRQISLIDGPTVLGWATWREIERRYSLGAIIARLVVAENNGMTLPAPPETLAHLILSATAEAGLLIASAENPPAARVDAEEGLRAIMRGIAGSPRA